ncbi:pyridoxal phosphate-dependent aminotransferase [Tissierella pigra]|uniref:MalY/PatB family protein n=1 Tax=Tissierella pigra TaxID=2607614 RepID=UPI001C0F7EDA|nr:MalY/PatB family protein [Tissierella pigra]MBU5425337.1 pyridoxal phosphate-dependent aminotransferase [Tissierella pigra]
MYDFDKIINRYGTNSMKWDGLKETFEQDNLLPLWVADMDFEVSPAISKELEKRVKHPIYGYMHWSDEYYKSVIRWMKRRHGWEIHKDWIVFTPGVVPAVSYAIKALTDIGDSVIIQTPVYHPFKTTIESNGRNVVTNPLIYKDGTYYMDLEDLERKIDSKTKVLILCSPHNPIGRVWTKKELNELGEICLKNNIIIISDEIHFDLIYKGNTHTVMADISPEIRDNCIVCTSPSKTFNIAGLQVSNIIIPNEKLREKYSMELEKDHIGRANVFGQEALIAAYNESEDWLDSLMEYLEENKNFFIDFIETRIPQLKTIRPEGTYLLWIDCSGLNMSSDELNEFFLNKCKLALNSGEMFGEEGKLFQRINIACPRAVLQEALIRIEKAVKENI